MGCRNAAGTYKCRLLVIGKNKNPRYLKGVQILPAHYRANKRAWATVEILKEWFENYFVPEARDHCRKQSLPENSKILLCSTIVQLTLLQELWKRIMLCLFSNKLNITYEADGSKYSKMIQMPLQKQEFMKAMLNACNSSIAEF